MSRYEQDFLGGNKWRVVTEHKAAWAIGVTSLVAFVFYLAGAMLYTFQSLLDNNIVMVLLLILTLLINFGPFSFSFFVVSSAHYYNRKALLTLVITLTINFVLSTLIVIVLLAGVKDIYTSIECSLGDSECLELPLTIEYCESDKEAVCIRSTIGYIIMLVSTLILMLSEVALTIYSHVWRTIAGRRMGALFADTVDTHYEMEDVFDD